MKISKELNCDIDTNSLTYNRLITHMYFLLERVKKKEVVNIELNSFIQTRYPKSWQIALKIIRYIEASLNKKVDIQDVGFLTIYVERLSRDNKE